MNDGIDSFRAMRYDLGILGYISITEGIRSGEQVSDCGTNAHCRLMGHLNLDSVQPIHRLNLSQPIDCLGLYTDAIFSLSATLLTTKEC